MQLFYAPDIVPPVYTLPEDESRHAVKVLRMGVGASLHLTDGRGNLFEAQVVTADVRGCVVKVVETFTEYGKRAQKLTMAVAPTKNSDRYEWFLEKATEIGCDVFVPLKCANSERQAFNAARAEKVVVSAMKQSLKAYKPDIEPLTAFGDVVARPFDGVKLIAHCRETERIDISKALSKTPLHDKEGWQSKTDGVVENTLILIGPEGDFTAEEVAMAEKNGFTSVSLSESRLRTETAAVYATVVAENMWRIRDSNS